MIPRLLHVGEVNLDERFGRVDLYRVWVEIDPKRLAGMIRKAHKNSSKRTVMGGGAFVLHLEPVKRET